MTNETLQTTCSPWLRLHLERSRGADLHRRENIQLDTLTMKNTVIIILLGALAITQSKSKTADWAMAEYFREIVFDISRKYCKDGDTITTRAAGEPVTMTYHSNYFAGEPLPKGAPPEIGKPQWSTPVDSRGRSMGVFSGITELQAP